MEAITEKILKVVNSCVTPQQLEVAANFAERAKERVHHEDWLDIASVIQNKSGQVLFFETNDWFALRRI